MPVSDSPLSVPERERAERAAKPMRFDTPRVHANLVYHSQKSGCRRCSRADSAVRSRAVSSRAALDRLLRCVTANFMGYDTLRVSSHPTTVNPRRAADCECENGPPCVKLPRGLRRRIELQVRA